MDRVGVVVPCKDEVATIETCLRALRAQQPAPARIVVVDNGSTDGSREVAARYADEVLLLPDITISTLRNRGAEALLAAQDANAIDVLAFVDADCELAPGWTAAALEALRTADLAGRRSLPAADDTWVARRWATVEERQAHGESYVWSQHLAIRASTFEKLQGFDDTLPTGEDIDLSRRVLETGGRIEFADGMVAIHHGFPSTLRGFVRRERWHTRAPGWYPRMSSKSRGLVLLAAAWGVIGLLSALLGARRRSARPVAAWTAGTAAGLPALGYVGGRDPRTAAQDGVLLGIWTAVRAVRLPRELITRGGR